VIIYGNEGLQKDTIRICENLDTTIESTISVNYANKNLSIILLEGKISDKLKIIKLNEQTKDINTLVISGEFKHLIAKSLGLSAIDITDANNLKYLNCNINNINSIEISNKRALKELYCDTNNIKNLEIPKETSLEQLSCSHNKLESLTLNKMESLVLLNCSNNNLPINGIPILNTSKENFKSWEYNNQEYNGIATQYAVGETINLSEFSDVVYGDKTETTTYEWITKQGKKLEIGTDYTEEEGVFVFLQSFVDSIYCKFKNNNLPAGDSICIYPFKLIPPLAFTFSYTKPENENESLWIKASSSNCTHIIVEDYIKGIRVLDECMQLKGEHSFSIYGRGTANTIKVYAQGIASITFGNDAGLQSLEISNCESLEKLYCNNNSLTNLDLSRLTNLQILECANNSLESLNLQGLENLNTVICSNNPSIGTLDFSASTNISSVQCSDAGIETIMFPLEATLDLLQCDKNNISTIEPEGSTIYVSNLDCSENSLRIGTLPHKDGDKIWNCANQKPIKINDSYSVSDIIDLRKDTVMFVDGEPFYTTYHWYKYYLKESYLLDTSYLQEVDTGQFLVKRSIPESIFCVMTNDAISNTEFKTTNANIDTKLAMELKMSSKAPVEISCTTHYEKDYVRIVAYSGVDSSVYSFNNSIPDNALVDSVFIYGDNIQEINISSTAVDSIFVFSKTIEKINCPNIGLSSITFDPACMNVQRINCDSDKLDTIAVSHLEKLTYLNVANNLLDTIAVSLNQLLEELYVQNNTLLDTLDVSANNKLKKLNCSGDSLKGLLLPNSASLTYLHCGHNELKNLDLSQQKNLETLLCYNNPLHNSTTSKTEGLYNLICNDNDTTKVLNLKSHTSLQYLNCSNIKLDSILLPEPTNPLNMDLICANNNLEIITTNDFLFLDSLLCDTNRLRISTMPPIKNRDQLTSWTYTKQERQAFHKDSFTIGETIDLSSEYEVNVNGTIYTSYVWKTKSGETLATEDEYYTEENGTFTFLRSPIDSIYCVMHNDAFSSDFEAGLISIIPDTAFVIKTQNADSLKISMAGKYLENHIRIQWNSDSIIDTVIGNTETIFTYPEQQIESVTENEVVETSDDYETTSSEETDTDNAAEDTITIVIYGNSIQSITISNESATGLNSYATSLDSIDCEASNIDTLDVNKSKNLVYLNCASDTLLETLSVNSLSKLSYLNVHNNYKLENLNVSKNESLQTLYCDSIGLTKLNVSANKLLKDLQCSNNYITELNLNENAILETLLCGNNKLTSLNIDNNKVLRRLCVQNNEIETLNVANNNSLRELNCNNNTLTKLKLDSLTLLDTLKCSNNFIDSLSLQNIENLKHLSCANNEMVYIDYKEDINLTTLDCSNNKLIEMFI